jgi:ribonuclease-3
MSPRAAAISDLERRIGHVFADRALLDQALTHASVGDKRPDALNNERLEFFGDRVLNLIVAEELLKRMPAANEGELSRAFHNLVNLETCAEVARRIGLSDALKMGGGSGKTGARTSDRVLGDACEALIAALYMEGGFDAARSFVLAFWEEPFRTVGEPARRNPKVVLQEWAFGRGLPGPRYTVVEQTGPSHKPRFRLEVQVEGFEPTAGEGGSIREAERVVAELMLARIGVK